MSTEKLMIVSESEALAHIDGCIDFWRLRKSEADSKELEHTADCYVDAWQSARVSLFGVVKR